jgi:ASPM-SPD-2-Hydin domain-containing protein
MRRRSLLICIVSILATLTVFSVYYLVPVFALRPIRTFVSSSKGDSPNSSICADGTPFLAALTGNVATDSSCFDYQGPYPSHQMTLTPSDQSFTLTVTPVLWGGSSSSDSRATILHVVFSSSNANLSLSSFVIGGLVINPASGSPPDSPGNVACTLDYNQIPTGPLYPLVTQFNISNPPQTTVCTDASLTFNDISGNPVIIEPTPIEFADGNTTRWDITGITGSSSISWVDLIVPGYPSDLVDSDGIDVDQGPSTPSNNLIQSFMADPNNFVAVAIDLNSGKVETAGGLSIPSVTASLTNDGIASPINVDPNAAISKGFTSQVNATTATPQQDAAGNPIKVPSPADPTLPGTCFNQAGSVQLLRTVWFSYTPIGDGSITIDTAGSRYDTALGMFTGTPGNLTLVNGTCIDDFVDQSQALHLQAQVQNVTVTHGTPYFVLVGESPTENGTQNKSDGTPTDPPVTVAQPLSNDATLFFSLVETPTPPGITLAPAPNTTLSFGSQVVGTASSAQTITVTSTGGTPISISNVSTPTGFTASGCTSAVPQGSSCQIAVVFQPSTTGTITGNLTFTDNVSGTARVYPLSGSGTDFSFPQPSQTASTSTLSSASPATFALTVSGSSGFSSQISFACHNLPTNTQCSFSPNVLTPGSGGSSSVTLTVSRISNSALSSRDTNRVNGTMQLGAIFLLAALLMIRQTKRTVSYPSLACMAFLLLSLSACGGGSSTPHSPTLQPPPGSYPFTVNATVSGGMPKTIDLTLLVD